jgi:hypothetical protein
MLKNRKFLLVIFQASYIVHPFKETLFEAGRPPFIKQFYEKTLNKQTFFLSDLILENQDA